VPGLCYNRGAAARRGCVVWAFRFCFGRLCGAPSFYYGIIISRLYLLVKSFCKTFSRFFATRPAAVRFSCVPSGSDPAGVMVYPWGIAAGVAGGGECRKHTRKIKRTFYINPLTFAFTCAILNATSKEVSPMQTFKNAIGYVRVSTEQQAKEASNSSLC
jgi:hypothetical protein